MIWKQDFVFSKKNFISSGSHFIHKSFRHDNQVLNRRRIAHQAIDSFKTEFSVNCDENIIANSTIK